VLGFYLGAGAGGAVLPLDDNNDDFWDDNNAEGSAAFKAFVGYRFHQNFAIEAYYADLGDFEFRRNVFGGTANADIESSGWGVDALGIFPLRRGWSLFGKVGGFRSTTKTQYTQVSGFPPGTNLNPERKEWNFKVGFGGQYDFSRNLAVRAEIESYLGVGDSQTGDGTITMVSMSIVGRF
jgi:OOP family OmpA-OmpF porin